MKIGIDASRAFLKKRTGIEEYSYQVIKHAVETRQCLVSTDVVLYVRKNQKIDFDLPKNWKIKIINWPYLWTQLGLSLEMLFHPVDVLFIPAHTVPLIHPKNTIVTIHGLEYEFCSQAYSFLERLYMRCSIKNSCKWAKTIVSVSENTKQDLMKLYKVPEEKITVIHEGYETNNQGTRNKEQKNSNNQNLNNQKDTKYNIQDTKYLLFIGRLEERKNIMGIVDAFEILKEIYKIPHKLILAGKPGFGFDKIQSKIQETRYKNQIILTGFVSEEEKWELLKKADVFVFPTLYEGFGIPILEAQSVGCPVVASNNSSIPEITGCSPKAKPSEHRRFSLRETQGCSAILVDPTNVEEIADSIYKLISDETAKNAIIQKGYENVKRFSWGQCSAEIVTLLHG